MVFNTARLNFFSHFDLGILAFFFAMMNSGIRKYKGVEKVIISFDKKSLQSMYIFFNLGWSDILNDRYVGTKDQTMICLLAGIKKTDPF